MAKTETPIVEGAGGSYLLDPATGKKTLIDPPTYDKTYDRGAPAVEPAPAAPIIENFIDK
jgi:hypothetical protein